MTNETNGQKEQTLQIYCKCGCPVFELVKVHRLTPGDENGPNILPHEKAWRCAGCGTLHLPQNMPKKDDGASKNQKENKLILPENNGKLKLIN